MKQFTILKVGYTAGLYGCSGEYFNCILTDDKGMRSFQFYGMYGVEERIARALKERGYEEVYTSTNYGKWTLKDVTRNFVAEAKALETANSI